MANLKQEFLGWMAILMSHFDFLSRRAFLRSAGVLGLTAFAHGVPHAANSSPIRVGFPVHRSGIGAAYGRWYERVAIAAADFINAEGGINGRPLELVIEDDATDPKRGSELMGKFATQLDCDVVCGTLFSHVVTASSVPAQELKIPYFVCSEGHHVASGRLNRYVIQPGITDVKSQVISVAPWIFENLGKKVAMIFPDYGFGYDHRDSFTPAFESLGGKVVAKIAVPATESSYFKYFPRIPLDVDVIYHVMVGPSVLTFVKELGEFYGSGGGPGLFGFIDSLETVSLSSGGLEFLDGSYFWEGHPRYSGPSPTPTELFYRAEVGVDGNGALIGDSRDISAYGHMFSCWETLHVIKRGMQVSGYRGIADRTKLIEAIESFVDFPYGREHPQGAKEFNGRTHQVFGRQHISQVVGGGLALRVTLPIESGYYPDEVDYTRHSF